MRKLCKKCSQRPVAINYYKEGKPFYRSVCDHCARGRSAGTATWSLAGYKKKTACDKCGFASKFQEQFNVYHVDGDLTNSRFSNLKTVCANCQRVLQKEGVKWRQGDLRPDF
jgi:protein-arginine kinase activator protein McsA